MIRRFGLAFVVAALVGGGIAGAEPAQSVPAIEWTFRNGGRLVWLDSSLRPLSVPAIRLAEPAGQSATGGTRYAYGWTFSPDRSRVVVGTSEGLRFIDLGRTSLDRKMERGDRPVAWPVRNRLFAIEGSQLLMVDPTAGRVLAERFVDGEILATRETKDGVALLVGSAGDIRPARLAVADSRGRLRTATLRRILAGWESKRSAGHDVRVAHPALAVDRAGGRAFLVGAGGIVADVDLRTLGVRYRRLVGARSLQKTISGSSRCAEWLGNGLVAVSGIDHQGRSYEAAGLTLIDVAAWTARRLDDRASTFWVARGLILAAVDKGIVAYGPDGSRRFQALGDEPAWVSGALGGRAYLGTRDRTFVVDLTSGRMLEEVQRALPLLVTPAGRC